jgi:hypothetical protein
LFLKYNSQISVLQENFLLKLVQSSSSNSIPTIARTLYLFLCENQAEIDVYSNAFPSITADIMFLCWKQNCVDTNFSKPTSFYTMKWSGRSLNSQPFVRLDSTFNYIMTKSRVFIINELQLNLTKKTTWTTARNMLYERALIEEQRQGWRWAYFNFGDGDIQVACPISEKLLKTNQINGDEIVIAQHFRSLISIQQSLFSNISSNQCFIFFDTFLLSASPAIAAIAEMIIPILFDGLLTQIVYHIDAMFNAFHRDALSFVLPYCSRYDHRSWWTSQAILIYRSLCLYGHVIQFNAVRITRQIHRAYPHNGDPWTIDDDMNLIPSSLIPLKTYMKQTRIVSALALQHYSGWSLNTTSNECRNQYTFVDPLTCRVGEKLNKTNPS